MGAFKRFRLREISGDDYYDDLHRLLVLHALRHAMLKTPARPTLLYSSYNIALLRLFHFTRRDYQCHSFLARHYAAFAADFIIFTSQSFADSIIIS
jgi:hypothetical protein